MEISDTVHTNEFARNDDGTTLIEIVQQGPYGEEQFYATVTEDELETIYQEHVEA